MIKMTTTLPQASHGFTLAEVVIAIAIFALMSAMAYGGLNSILRTNAQTKVQSERLIELQRAMRLIERDVEFAIDRGIRDEYNEAQPAFSGGGFDDYILRLTRTGRANPLLQPRSILQRVSYVINEEKLIRRTWRSLDRAPNEKAQDVELLNDITEVTLRFLDKQQQWHQSWPPIQDPNSPNIGLPIATEFTLRLKDWGDIKRIFQIASAQPKTPQPPPGLNNEQDPENNQSGAIVNDSEAGE